MLKPWFTTGDLTTPTQEESVQPTKQALGVDFATEPSFTASADNASIAVAIGQLMPGRSVFFKTDGAWSNDQLLGYILAITGPAEVYITTYALSEEAITKFIGWQDTGKITELHAIIDVGLRNRKPAIFHRAAAAFKKLKVAHCHAKTTVVINATHHITLIGSANYTKNPRKEVGVIIWDKAIAEANQHWIKEETDGNK